MSFYFVTCQNCDNYYASKKEFSQCGKCGKKNNEGFDLPKWIKYDKDLQKYITNF